MRDAKAVTVCSNTAGQINAPTQYQNSGPQYTPPQFQGLLMKSFLTESSNGLLIVLSGCSDTIIASVENCYPTGMPAETGLQDPARTLGVTGNYNYSLCSSRYAPVISAAQVTNGVLPDVRHSQSGSVGIDSAFWATQFGKSSDRIWDITATPSRLQTTLETYCADPSAWSSILKRLGCEPSVHDINNFLR